MKVLLRMRSKVRRTSEQRYEDERVWACEIIASLLSCRNIAMYGRLSTHNDWKKECSMRRADER